MTSSVIQNPSGERIDFSFHPGPRRDVLVILGHGLTGNKERPLQLALATELSARGWPCMRISYTGHGKSEGRFEDACVTKETGDLKAVLGGVPDYVRVVYVGHSMGAAVGVLTAAEDLRIRLLVSLAGMTHTADFVDREFGDVVPGEGCMWGEAEFPLSEDFVADMKSIGSILSAAAQVIQPWLLIHGTDDDLVPVADGRAAHAAAVCDKQWLEIPGAGHSLDGDALPVVIDAVDAWLVSHIGQA